MSTPAVQVKSCVESLEGKPVDAGIYVEVAGPGGDGKYTAQRFEIKDGGATVPENVQLIEGATYYEVVPSGQPPPRPSLGGNRKSRKSSRKSRKSAKKNRKSSSSRRSRK